MSYDTDSLILIEIDNNCPRKFCSGTVDHAALYLDGEQSVLFFGMFLVTDCCNCLGGAVVTSFVSTNFEWNYLSDDCAQKIDNTYQLVGRPIPINEVIPSGAVSGPLQSVWTDMGAGQFRMHVLDSVRSELLCI